jgi:Ca2+-binding RTX toxin-like protein
MAQVNGTSSRDTLRGTSGIDQIFGLDGDDLILGSAGADRIDGGNNRDTVDYSASSGPVTIDLGQIFQSGGDAQGDQLYSIESVVGSKFNDSLRAGTNTLLLEGGAGADTITGYQGFGIASYAGSRSAVSIDLNFTTQHGGDAEGDQLYNIHDVLGSAFDDFIFGGFSANDLSGGKGNDTLKGGGSNDRINGGEGRDTLLLDTVNDSGVSVTLDGGPGGVGYASYTNGESDTLTSIEDVVGTKYRDVLSGSGVDNKLSGMGGDDDLFGNGGADELRGGAGNDWLFGGEGNDRLFGDGNDDFLEGGIGRDQLDGGDGIDTASYMGSTAGVTVSLVPSAINTGGDGEGDTLTRIENLTGSAFDDWLTGDDFGNRLDGGEGNDTLTGGAGRDLLIGGKGDDTLSGGIDGARDTYQFQLFNEGSQLNIGNDTITDWESFDRVQLLNGSSNVNLAQVDNNTVITIDNVLGSITVLNSQVSDFSYLL